MVSLEWRLSVMEVVGHPPLSCRGKLIGIALAGLKGSTERQVFECAGLALWQGRADNSM